MRFIGITVRESPGLAFSFLLTSAALVYLLIKKRGALLSPDGLALIIMIAFGIIALASNARLIRYSFPAIMAVPFLVGILMSGNGCSVPGRSAGIAAGLVFFGLLAASLPTLHRAERQASLGRTDAAFAYAIKCNEKDLVLATDSNTLNINLLGLSRAVTRSATGIAINSVAYSAMNGQALEKDLQLLQGADVVIFQDDDALGASFTNSRVQEYRRYIGQHSEFVPTRIWGDVLAYSKHCGP